MPGWRKYAPTSTLSTPSGRRPYYLTLLAGAYLVQEPGLDITVMQDRADAARKKQARGERALRVLRREHHRADAS